MPTYLTIVLLAIAFALMLSLHILCCWRIMIRGRREGGMQTQETFTGLLPGDVEKLPSYNYNNECSEETGSETAICAVCLESFCIGDKCRVLPQCKHSFHANCVDSWLMKHALCPICRGDVELTTKDEMLPKEREVAIGIPEYCSLADPL